MGFFHVLPHYIVPSLLGYGLRMAMLLGLLMAGLNAHINVVRPDDLHQLVKKCTIGQYLKGTPPPRSAIQTIYMSLTKKNYRECND